MSHNREVGTVPKIVIFPHAPEEFADPSHLVDWLQELAQGHPDPVVGPGCPPIPPWNYRLRRMARAGIVSTSPPYGTAVWKWASSEDVLTALPGASILFTKHGKVCGSAIAQSVKPLNPPDWFDFKIAGETQPKHVEYPYCMEIEPNSIAIYNRQLPIRSISDVLGVSLQEGFRRTAYILIDKASLCQKIGDAFPHLGL